MTARQRMRELRPGVRQLAGQPWSCGPQRVAHILRGVRGECVPTRVIVLQVAPLRREIEHGRYEDTLLCGHAVAYSLSDGEIIDVKGMDFGRAGALWDFIAARRAKDRTTWVYAHALGYQLTLLDFWRRLETCAESHLWSVLSDPPTIICTRLGRSVVRYVDTANYFREPLPRLLGGVGGWSSWALDPGAPIIDHIAWCRKAATALGDLLCRIIGICRRELKCTWQSTAASLSWTVYRRWYTATPIYIHACQAASSLEMDSLFGGLLHLSRLGCVTHPTQSWDVNSLYPWVMATQPMPVKLERYHPRPSVSDLHAALRGYYCVAEVLVEHPAYQLPTRSAANASYSTASGVYVLCGRELLDAVTQGMVYSVRRLATYHVADCFSSFVHSIYPRKLAASEKGDLAERWLWKMCLNGLAGKFAQRYRRWKNAEEIFAAKRWGQWWHRSGAGLAPVRARAIAGQPQLLETGGFGRDALPIITAAVASAGRTRIREIAALAGSPRPLYIDCDCLHLGESGGRALAAAGLCCNRRLGAVKLVYAGDDAHYWGPKHYRIGTNYVSNVIHLGARKLEDGYWLQATKRGLEQTLNSGALDRVLVRDQLVTLGDGHT